MKDLSVYVCSPGFSMRSCLTKYDCLGNERAICVCVCVCSRGFSMRGYLTKYDYLGYERPLCVCLFSWF